MLALSSHACVGYYHTKRIVCVGCLLRGVNFLARPDNLIWTWGFPTPILRQRYRVRHDVQLFSRVGVSQEV